MEIEKILEFMKKCFEEKEAALINLHSIECAYDTKPKHRSEQIDLLATALAKAQSEMPVAKKDSENPYFKSSYADLEEIVSASRPCLSKNGLSVTQNVITDNNGSMVLRTVLMHSSGQWAESAMRVLPAKNDIQTISCYITYLKRINYAALVGVVASSEDDDGEKAVAAQRETFIKNGPIANKYKPQEESSEVITKEQFEELDYELQEIPYFAEEIKSKLHLNSIADLPKSKYSVTIRRVREVKQSLKEGK